MDIAIAGGVDQLGAVTMRRLAVERGVGQLVWLGPSAPTVASARLRWAREPADIGACDAVVALPGAAPTLVKAAVSAGARRVVLVEAAGARPSVDEAVGSAEVTRLRAGLVLGLRTAGELGRLARRRQLPDAGGQPVSLIWEDDLGEAIARALASPSTGSFDVAVHEPATPRELAEGAGWTVVPSTFPVGPEAAPDPALAALGWKPRYPDAAAVLRRAQDMLPERPDRRIDYLMRLLDLVGRRRVDPVKAPTVQRVALCLTGPGGGDYGLLLQGQSLRVIRGELPEPGGALTLGAKLFRGLLAGTESLPTAQLTGRVRIEGDPFSIALLGSICHLLQRFTEQRGPVGWIARRYTRWLVQEATP